MTVQLLRLMLYQSAKPGDTVFLKINFETKLPSRIIRTGYKDDFYFVGQWFPKFGVYESTGMRYAITGAGIVISFTTIPNSTQTIVYMT